MKTRPVAVRCFLRTQKRTNGQTDIRIQIVHFRIFVKATLKIFNKFISLHTKKLKISTYPNKEPYWIFFWKTRCEVYELSYTKASHFQQPMFFSVSKNSISTNNEGMIHVLTFGMLDTSHLVTPYNALWSHNVAHNCDHATFNVDCCYHILQHLLRICMSTKVSVNFRACITPDRQTAEIF
jgi:hypothetical protein